MRPNCICSRGSTWPNPAAVLPRRPSWFRGCLSGCSSPRILSCLLALNFGSSVLMSTPKTNYWPCPWVPSAIKFAAKGSTSKEKLKNAVLLYIFVGCEATTDEVSQSTVVVGRSRCPRWWDECRALCLGLVLHWPASRLFMDPVSYVM